MQSASLGPKVQGGGTPSVRDSIKEGGKLHRRPKNHRNLAKLTKKYHPNPTPATALRAFTVDRGVLQSLLVPECVGVRIYLAKDTLTSAQNYQLILVGVRKNPNPTSENDKFLDLISKDNQGPGLRAAYYYVIQTGDRCPANCDLTSPLHTK
ncbi:hypothetical protein GCM10011378_08670 [Hymenobacter glacieicola]|uniref:Uncharacterized protein n=2 Tax=Hymenobacter glacieicola TaxID=1562124 RepID=A0ABQ1WNY1_9BACT|nr:hypothetical protein GCM10011378_08670 [Hymenobacter glacieicola]